MVSWKRLLATGASAAGMMLISPVLPAAAQEHPPPIFACGGQITIEVLKDTTNFKELDFGFQTAGNAVLRVSDGDSSVLLRLPGRARVTFDPETGTSTQSLTGQTLLVPFTEEQRAAIEAAGLPELALIKGRVVITEEFNPETGEPISAQVVSHTPNVTDVCALLDE
jgi:hypothetical protein